MLARLDQCETSVRLGINEKIAQAARKQARTRKEYRHAPRVPLAERNQ